MDMRFTADVGEEGVMTGDLYALSALPDKKRVDSLPFLREVAARLAK